MMESVDISSLGTPQKDYFKQYDLSVIKCTVIFKKHLSGCFLIKNFWRADLSSPKPLLHEALQKMFLMKQFFGKVLSLYFDLLLNKL